MATATRPSASHRGRSRPAETVLVAGCDSALGYAIARQFDEADWWVFAGAATLSSMEQLEEAGIQTVEFSPRQQSEIESVVEGIIDEAGRIDCLVTIPRCGPIAPVEGIPGSTMRRLFDDTLHGAHRQVRAVLPHMRRQQSGTITAIIPVDGRLPWATRGAIASSMAGIDAMWNALRAELSETDVNAVTVEYWPDPAWTPYPEPPEDAFDGYRRLERVSTDIDDLGGLPGGTEPTDIATAAVNAATCPEPDPRYPVGPIAKGAEVGRFVPDRFRDLVIKVLTRVVK